MKAVLAPVVVIVVLVAAAQGFRRAAAIEDVLATAEEQLTTAGATSRETEAGLDSALSVAGRLPVLGTRLEQDIRRNRATQAYWQGQYTTLTSGTLAPAAGEADAGLLLLSANAAFREAIAREKSPQALARDLDEVLQRYVAVLDRNPGNRDGAYNYEFVVRLRAALANGRGTIPSDTDPRSMQGEPGQPPEGTPTSDFNVIVPLRPEERQEQLNPGSGNTFKRKG